MHMYTTMYVYYHFLVYTGRDTYQEGLACYRLGNAYEGIGQHDTAIQVSDFIIKMAFNSINFSFVQYHKRYLERCKYHSDDEGIGNAYEALARSFERYTCTCMSIYRMCLWYMYIIYWYIM